MRRVYCDRCGREIHTSSASRLEIRCTGWHGSRVDSRERLDVDLCADCAGGTVRVGVVLDTLGHLRLERKVS